MSQVVCEGGGGRGGRLVNEQVRDDLPKGKRVCPPTERPLPSYIVILDVRLLRRCHCRLCRSAKSSRCLLILRTKPLLERPELALEPLHILWIDARPLQFLDFLLELPDVPVLCRDQLCLRLFCMELLQVLILLRIVLGDLAIPYGAGGRKRLIPFRASEGPALGCDRREHRQLWGRLAREAAECQVSTAVVQQVDRARVGSI